MGFNRSVWKKGQKVIVTSRHNEITRQVNGTWQKRYAKVIGVVHTPLQNNAQAVIDLGAYREGYWDEEISPYNGPLAVGTKIDPFTGQVI